MTLDTPTLSPGLHADPIPAVSAARAVGASAHLSPAALSHNSVSPAAVSGAHLRLPIRRAVVCVPAKNEAARLPGFFYAMSRAVTRALSRGVGCDLVLALDGCTDGSRALADAVALSFPCPVHILELPEFGMPHAGRVRRAAMEAGLERVPPDARAEAALLTTDADTHVADDWITASADSLRQADLVAGWVDWDTEEVISGLVRQEIYFSELHRHRRRVDPVAHDCADPHHKQYGASLGVRANAYAAVGGLPDMASSEDVALTRAVRLAGLRVRQDRSVRVLTSTRRSGRASGGFSDAISSVIHREDDTGGLWEVPDPRYLTKCYQQSARLRRAFSRSQQCVESRGRGVGTPIPDFEFEQAWASAPTADAFVTRLLGPASGGSRAPVVTLERAEAWLDANKEEDAP